MSEWDVGPTRLYMKAGMYFPVHEIQMLLSIELVDTLLVFHAITGCDSVSQFSGHGKKTALSVFKKHHTDLVGLGKGSLTENIATSIDKFIFRTLSSWGSVNYSRSRLSSMT